MCKIFHPLLALIASATDKELAKYVEYLKRKNKILRSRLPKQVHTTWEERQTLVKCGRPLGRAIEELITIVSPGSFYRWVCANGQGRPKPKNTKGGQRKPKELRELVLAIAEETGFGLTRIVGELRKLGIKKISRQTVRNILKEHGIEPSPDRTSDSWVKFLQRHGETLWGCDFFSVKSVTAKGIRDLYVMVFLCLKTREVIVTESTEHPNSAWVCQQTEWFAERTKEREKQPQIILHDRDVKFTKEFTQTVKDMGMKTNPLPKGSPNLNGRGGFTSIEIDVVTPVAPQAKLPTPSNQWRPFQKQSRPDGFHVRREYDPRESRPYRLGEVHAAGPPLKECG